ncbi:hypothetical protein ASF63_15540 [Microbacterium sp. Leaf320]|nr:hypothetical protein ASF63_15540 [Microbacterium sp. Leaf320]
MTIRIGSGGVAWANSLARLALPTLKWMSTPATCALVARMEMLSEMSMMASVAPLHPARCLLV